MTNQNKTMRFSVEDIQLIEEAVDKKEFSLLRVDAFATGKSLHDTFVSEDTLRKTAQTILQKPFVFAIDERYDDLFTHDEKEVAGGFVPHNSRLEFKTLEDGRLMLSTDVLIWKRYSGKLLEYFARDDGKKGVSVEIEIFDSKEDEKSGLLEILDFSYNAITGLGDMITSAIPNAQAVMAFSEDYRKALENYNKDIELPSDNYLGIENMKKDKIDFSLNSNQIIEILNNLLADNKYGDGNWCKYWVETYDDVYAYVRDNEENKTYRIPFIFDGESTFSLNMDEKEIVIHGGYLIMAEKDEKFSYSGIFGIEDMAKMFAEEDEDEEDVKKKFADAKLEYAEGKDPSVMMSAMYASLQKMEKKMAKLEEANMAYASENDELKKKFAEADEEKKEFAVNSFLKVFSEKFEITEPQLVELKEKSKEFSLETIGQWENHCKAFSFDNLELKKKVEPTSPEENKDIKIYSWVRTEGENETADGDEWSRAVEKVTNTK